MILKTRHKIYLLIDVAIPVPRPFVTFRNKLPFFYGEELLAPH
jgi:hypothetical protein